MRRTLVFALVPSFCLMLAMVLCGCQKTVHGPGLGDVAYTKRQTLVRAAPDLASRTLVSLGANVEVAVSARRDGFSKVAIDDGRIVGWVDSDSLSPTPVRESAAKPRRATPATKAEPAPPAKPAAPPETQAMPQPVVTSPEAEPKATSVSPPPAVVVQPAATTPDTGRSKPQGDGGAPVKARQVGPEVFDPF